MQGNQLTCRHNSSRGVLWSSAAWNSCNASLRCLEYKWKQTPCKVCTSIRLQTEKEWLPHYEPCDLPSATVIITASGPRCISVGSKLCSLACAEASSLCIVHMIQFRLKFIVQFNTFKGGVRLWWFTGWHLPARPRRCFSDALLTHVAIKVDTSCICTTRSQIVASYSSVCF